MNAQIERETDPQDPQNIPINNKQPHTDNKMDKQSQKIPIPSSLQSSEGQQIFETAFLESLDVIRKIEEFSLLDLKTDDDYLAIEELILTHVGNSIYPTACSAAGDLLLRNGKFVLFFIDVLTRKQKSNYLKKYLLTYFNCPNKITNDKQLFIEQYQNQVQGNAQQLIKQGQKPKVLLSPSGSSNNDQNWSTKVQQDKNSDFKQSIFESQQNIKSEVKLKRQIKEGTIQVNEEHEKSEKAVKNSKKTISTRKSVKKSVKKSARKIEKNEEAYQTRRKSNEKAKKTVSKSNRKQTLSVQKSTKKNLQVQQDVMGSCYHYEIGVNPRNHKKQLKQIRTSARLSIKKGELMENVRSNNQAGRHSKSKQKLTLKRQSKQKRTQKLEDTKSDDSQIEEDVEWIKNHLKEINIFDVQLYTDFTALTKNDQKITRLLKQMESSQEASQTLPLEKYKRSSRSVDKKDEREVQIDNDENTNDNRTETRIISKQSAHKGETEKLKNFSDIKEELGIQELPLTIECVVDHNINGHGIYALLKLGRLSEIQMGTAYVLSPLTYGVRANKKHIKEDLNTAMILAGQYRDNIGYIPMNEEILAMVQKKSAIL